MKINTLLLKIALAVLVSLVVTGCGVTKSESVVAPAKQKGGFLGLSTQDDLQVTGEEALKGEKLVVIPKFRIGYFTENNPGGFTSTGGHKTIINSTLTGVDSKLLQKITDEAYDNFVKELTNKGYKVISKKSLSKSKTYNEFKITDTQTMDKSFFGPDIIYVTPSNMKTSDALISKGFEVQGLLKDFEASIIEVTLNIAYLAQEVESTLNIATGIKVGQVPTVTPGSKLTFYGYQASKCVGYCPNTVANITLGQPVFTSDKMGELKDVTGAGDKVGDAIVMLGSWMTSGLKVRNSKRYELVANPELYKKAMVGVINKTTKTFVEEMAKNK